MKAWFASLLMLLIPLGTPDAGERFACNMGALTSAERARHEELSRSLFAAVRVKKELRNGYAFRLPSGMLATAAGWVALERRCCPFFTFDLELVKHDGPLWLRITGAPGVKAFIRSELQI